MRMHFFGLFVISAAYLPWVFLGFSLIIHGVWPTGDLVGLMVGHTYFFLDDVWPRGGGTVVGGVRVERSKIVRAPAFVKQLFGVDFVGGRGGIEVVALDGGLDVGGATAAAIPREGNEGNDSQPQEIPGATGEYEVWNLSGASNNSENQPQQLNTRGNNANDEEGDYENVD
ncbi:UNVERIFIED_CONTAM: hypothetical protein HDU68_010380 [Siphonaria sp. JEL0065]|nr:hypothetical protein HDU68_010380 [Siphonaria sp. JEL0065]